MNQILIVEDDRTLCAGVALALQSEGTQCTQTHSLAGARRALAERTFSLLILDINLPDGSGLAFLRCLRQKDQTPVLLLTANDLELDIVTGLEAGADDYITKPFSLAVLRARVAALLRRAAPPQGYRCGGLCLDFAQASFTRNGSPVELSRTEQKLLRIMTANPGRTLPRSLLLERVWGTTEYVDENALSVTVKRLRDKLGEEWIGTVYGTGYVWKEPV